MASAGDHESFGLLERLSHSLLTSLLPLCPGCGNRPPADIAVAKPADGSGSPALAQSEASFLGIQPQSQTHPKGQGQCGPEGVKKYPPGGLEPKSDPRYAITMAATVARRHGKWASPPCYCLSMTTCRDRCYLSPHFADMK